MGSNALMDLGLEQPDAQALCTSPHGHIPLREDAGHHLHLPHNSFSFALGFSHLPGLSHPALLGLELWLLRSAVTASGCHAPHLKTQVCGLQCTRAGCPFSAPIAHVTGSCVLAIGQPGAGCTPRPQQVLISSLLL